MFVACNYAQQLKVSWRLLLFDQVLPFYWIAYGNGIYMNNVYLTVSMFFNNIKLYK